MKLRLKFSKTGRLKYIGHLDLLNIFNRAIKSAKLPVLYSKGFNPHMLVVFADPLSLGVSSVSEYVDIDFSDSIIPDNKCSALQAKDTFHVFNESLIIPLNGKLPDGLKITDVYLLSEPYKRVPSLVVAAAYDILGIPDISQDDIDSFMAQDTIEVMKKTKRKTELTNIKPDIYSAVKIENGITVVLACGSTRNLKASLFAEIICSYLNFNLPIYKLSIERKEIFAKHNTEHGYNGFLPLMRQ